MSRTIILIFTLFFCINGFTKNPPPLNLQISSSTTKHTDLEKPVTLTGTIISDYDFETLNAEWIFEGDIEYISGDKFSVLNNVKAGVSTEVQVTVKIKNLSSAKIIFSVYREINGSKFGQTQIYVPTAGVTLNPKDTKNFKAEPYVIKDKKIIY